MHYYFEKKEAIVFQYYKANKIDLEINIDAYISLIQAQVFE